MNGKPLIESGDAALIARAYNLGLKIVPNLPHVLTRSDLEHWEKNIDKLKEVVRNGMIAPLFEHVPDLDGKTFPGSSAFPFEDFYTTKQKPSVVVRFSSVGRNVKSWFYGMIVPAVEPSKLTLDRLRRTASDEDAISGLGGEKHCDLSLGELRWCFENGVFQRARWYGCFALDANSVRRSLFWGWYDGGWNLSAGVVPDADWWCEGDVVVSRKRSRASN